MHVSGRFHRRSNRGSQAGLGVFTYLALILAALALVPVTVGAADSPFAAKVVSADGRVSVWRNGDLLALFAGNTVRVGETIVTGEDGIARFQISDGSFFEVYPNSQVQFRANPNIRDLLDVLLGKIKVHIQTFGGNPNPYRVHSPTAVISVRGTTFNVAVDDEKVTLIDVEEGQVVVAHRTLPSDKTIQLLPGQYLRVYPNAPLATAGINKGGLVARIAEAVRDALYVVRTVGGGGKAPVPGAPGGGCPPPCIPADPQAPAPPPLPPPPPPGP